MFKLIEGFGINDVPHQVIKKEKINGKYKVVWRCPYYKDWTNMLVRCFNLNSRKNRPTYEGCTVSEEWKYFSNFIKWVDSQPNRDWQNCSLDKDFLIQSSNRHYSPETCVYIPLALNGFILSCNSKRGRYMVGVYFDSSKNKFVSYCNNPLTSKKEHVGYYTIELEAHKAWQAKKHEYACLLADLQDDPRVANALRQRYDQDKDWSV